MSEDLIITEEELNSLLNNLDLKFIAQKLKIENVDKSIITLIKIVKSLEQENKQLKEELEKKNKKYWQQKCFYYSSILYSLEEWLKTFHKNSEFEVWEITRKIQELKEKYK